MSNNANEQAASPLTIIGAHNLVSAARLDWFDRQRVTIGYLLKIREEVSEWLEEIDLTITEAKISEAITSLYEVNDD